MEKGWREKEKGSLLSQSPPGRTLREGLRFAGATSRGGPPVPTRGRPHPGGVRVAPLPQVRGSPSSPSALCSGAPRLHPPTTETEGTPPPFRQLPGLSHKSASHSVCQPTPPSPQPQKPLQHGPRARPAEPKPGRKRHLAAPARGALLFSGGRGSSPAPPPRRGTIYGYEVKGARVEEGRGSGERELGGCERVRAAGETLLRAAFQPPRRGGGVGAVAGGSEWGP